jgi:hypothetical protein
MTNAPKAMFKIKLADQQDKSYFLNAQQMTMNDSD